MSEEKQRFVSASYMETLLDAFADIGCSRGDLLSEAGLDNAALQDPDRRLPMETVTKIWVAARQKTSDPLLGLQVGKHIRPGSFSVLGHLLMTAATLEDALDKAAKFAILVGDGGVFSVDKEAGNAVLKYDQVDKDIPCREERIEALMASLVGFSRWITGEAIIPISVSFMHAALTETEDYKAVFLVTPDFQASSNSIILSKTDLKRPLLQANPELSVLLDSHAEKVMSRVTQFPPFIRQLRQSMKERFSQTPNPDLDSIAADLNLTPRSLQRKLTDLNTSFQDQLNQLRRDWAMEQLKDNQKPLSDISYALGFSDPASFNRAFKRWTGKPPGKWLEDQA